MKKILILCLIAMIVLVGCENFSSYSKPTVHLIAMGYSYSGTTVADDLDGTQNDMNALYEQTKAMYENAGYSYSATLIYDQSNSIYKKTYRNGSESTSNLGTKIIFSNTSTLEDLIEDENIGSNDITIFFYSGHGISNTGYLVGPYYSSTYLDLISPTDFVSLVKATNGNKIILIDSCYSGNLSFSENANTDIGSAYSSLFSSSDLDLTYTWGIYASSSSQTSKEHTTTSTYYGTNSELGWKDPHGMFSAGLLNSLGYDLSSGTANTTSGTITVTSLFENTNSYVNNMLSYIKSLKGHTYSQTTTESTNFIDLVLFTTEH
ncbi:MAG: caspase family protein [Sphaerochaetaceae bacterium]|nr:caspase family protein [Sphaerochaetaceae bacterium]